MPRFFSSVWRLVCFAMAISGQAENSAPPLKKKRQTEQAEWAGKCRISATQNYIQKKMPGAAILEHGATS